MSGHKVILRVDRVIGRIEDLIAVIGITLLTICTIVAVVLRYVMGVPNVGGEEIARYLFVTLVFIGISMCVREHKHLGVTIFVDMLPSDVSSIIKFLADVITAISFVFLSCMSWIYVRTAYLMMQTSVATGLPMSCIYSVMAFGLSLSAIRSLMIIWDNYISKSRVLAMTVKENAQ